MDYSIYSQSTKTKRVLMLANMTAGNYDWTENPRHAIKFNSLMHAEGVQKGITGSTRVDRFSKIKKLAEANNVDWIHKMNEDGLLRINFMIPLMAQSPSQHLRDIVEDLGLNDIRKFFGPGSYMEELYQEDDNQTMAEFLLENNHGCMIAEVAAPVMAANRMGSYSWGYTNTQTIIGYDFQDVVRRAFEWRDEIDKKKRKTS